MNVLAKRDLIICLAIWLGLEVISFGILPVIGLSQPNLNLTTWLVASLPIGIAGAFLLASSTQITTAEIHQNHPRRRRRNTLARWASWFGLIGIGFPILVIALQILTKLLSVLAG